MGGAILRSEAVVPRRILVGVLVCLAVSLLIALSSSLSAALHYGTSLYLVNGDEHVYPAIARIPYWGEWALRDPFSHATDRVPTLHAWALFVLPAKLTAALRLPVTQIPLVMCVLGATLLPLALFLLFWQLLRQSPKGLQWTVCCTVVCLADAGFVGGRSFIANAVTIVDAMRGALQPHGELLSQYRVVKPMLTAPFLFGLAACVSTPTSGSLKRLLLGVICFALCIYQYFFFWTAAGVVLFLYGFVLLCRYLVRRDSAAGRRLRDVALIAAGGLLLGTPQVVNNWRTFSDPKYQRILERLQRGQHLLPSDPLRVQNLRNFWVWAKLAVGLGTLVLLRRYDLGFIWVLTAVGYVLANSALVTGLEFENARWGFMFSTFGEILVLAVLCMLADRVSAQGRVAFVALLACTALVMSGVWIRYIEVTQCAEPRAYTQALLATAPFAPALLEKKTNCTIAGTSLEAKVLRVHTECAQLDSSPQTAGTSRISMAGVVERHSLNGWLEGLSSEEYRRSTPQDGYSTASTFGHPEWKRNAILARRMALFSGLSIRWRATVQKYRPTHLLLPLDKTPNPLLPWREIAGASGLCCTRWVMPTELQGIISSVSVSR